MKFRALAVGVTAMALFGAAGAANASSSSDGNQEGPASQTPAKKKHKAARRAPYKECCGIYRSVYAEAWYGSKKVVAPVRRGEHGDEVLLPGGIWIACELSCEYTLRKQTLDFWERVTGHDLEASPGYPRKDFYVDEWGRRRGYAF
jgi:hypothetical protein